MKKEYNKIEISGGWWANTISNIIGTVVGIVITFGVGIWVDHNNREKDKRLTTMMIIYGVTERADLIHDAFEKVIESAAIVGKIPDMTVQDVADMPEDSVNYYLNSIFIDDTNYNDFARNLFNTNLDIIRSSDNFKFFISVEKAYDFLDSLEKLMEEHGPNHLLREVDEVLKEAELQQGVTGMSSRWNLMEMVKSNKIRELIRNYSTNFLQGGPKVLAEIKEMETNLMQTAKVTPEELKDFVEKYE